MIALLLVFILLCHSLISISYKFQLGNRRYFKKCIQQVSLRTFIACLFLVLYYRKKCNSVERKEKFFRYVSVIGHKGTNPNRTPENTLESIQLALALGADGVDVDIQLSGDGVLVLYHRPYLQQLTNRIGTVNQYHYKILKGVRIQCLQNGIKGDTEFCKSAPLTSFEEAASFLINNRSKMTTELKNYKSIPAYVSMYNKYPELYNTSMHSTFDYFIAYSLKQADPNILTCIGYRNGRFTHTDGTMTQRIHSFPLHQIWRILKFWKDRGPLVISFVVDDPDMKKYMKILNVPYVTNHVAERQLDG